MADFSDAEKRAIWNALQQFVDNCQEGVDLHQEDPKHYPMPEHYEAAQSALERLDGWVAELGLGGKPSPR